MEIDTERELSFPNFDTSIQVDIFQEKSTDLRGKCEIDRPETPLSDTSTSGVCSLSSSYLESFDENLDLKPRKDPEEILDCPPIIYQKRNILSLMDNLYPFAVFQTTNVPDMNMSNYWERRSVYHRLGPYGHIDEFDCQKCFLCDFYAVVPKRL